MIKKMPQQNGFVIAARRGDNVASTLAWFAREEDAEVFGEEILRANPDLPAVSLLPVAAVLLVEIGADGMTSGKTLKQEGIARYDAAQADEKPS